MLIPDSNIASELCPGRIFQAQPTSRIKPKLLNPKTGIGMGEMAQCFEADALCARRCILCDTPSPRTKRFCPNDCVRSPVSIPVFGLNFSIRQSCILALTISLALCGCVSVPPAASDKASAGERLSAHVAFLAQPALAGRKTRSAGAQTAREYIEARFQADGLVPWAQETNFEVSYKLGKNVVGVLPGSDSSLSNEIVLVCAHYDHVGRENWKIHPGAADNASGVAALLETALQTTQSGHRPRRTIAFASFDAEEEMLFGSMAFTCRPDVEKAHIVAVVAVDMLGRDFMDVVTNTLLVIGTENRPAFQAQLSQYASQSGLRLLPIPSVLAGPTSDHASFINRGALCLLFTCGTFNGYHEPTDTPDKLNYTNLERSAQIVLKTVEALANVSSIPTSESTATNRDEIKSIHTIISEICANPRKAGVKTNNEPRLLRLKANLEKALEAQTDTPATRESLFIQTAAVLMPGAAKIDPKMIDSPVFPMLAHIYFNCQGEMMDAEKQVVSLVLKRPPNLVRGLPEFKYEKADLRDGDFSLRQTGPETFSMNALVNRFSLNTYSKTRIWPIKSFGIDFSGSIQALDCSGTRSQLADYCLFDLIDNHTNAAYAQAINKMLRAINGTDPQGAPADWVTARLAQTGQTRTEWFLASIQTTNWLLSTRAMQAASHWTDARVVDAACKIVIDTNVPALPRLCAVRLLVRDKQPSSAAKSALDRVVDDPSVISREIMPEFQLSSASKSENDGPVISSRSIVPQFQEDYPLANTASFQALRPILAMAQANKNTLGQEVRRLLKDAGISLSK